jgi:hypothetical protein
MLSSNGHNGVHHPVDEQIDSLYSWVAPPQPEVVTLGYHFPEAPASVNVRLLIEGRDCQLTLRDRDEGRLLERLAVVLAQYPEGGNPHTPSQGQDGWCAVHQCQDEVERRTGREEGLVLTPPRLGRLLQWPAREIHEVTSSVR